MAILSFGNRDHAIARANKSALAESLEPAIDSDNIEHLAQNGGTGSDLWLAVPGAASGKHSDTVKLLLLGPVSAAFHRVQSRKYEIVKRAVDLGLVALLSPLICISIAIIGTLVAATSQGPILYTQERLGRHGRPFKIFKFRTMKANAEQVLAEYLLADPRACLEWFETHKLREDPRVTVCGRFLRRTSLDELPQLINVLRGEMSLVGPRPIVWAEREKYGERFCFYSAALPGVTGLWQVSGRCDVTYSTRVALDEDYVRHWSLKRDFLILMRTPGAVWRRHGAY
jgi:lipopolysaccharide/colanic/teichoic acid biosynthesis glycosyltransferase